MINSQLDHSSWNCVSTICWLCCCWWHGMSISEELHGWRAGGVCPETSQSVSQSGDWWWKCCYLYDMWPLLHGQSCIISCRHLNISRALVRRSERLTRAAWQKEWKFSRVAIITGPCKLHVHQEVQQTRWWWVMTMILQVNCLQISVQLKAITSPVQCWG